MLPCSSKGEDRWEGRQSTSVSLGKELAALPSDPGVGALRLILHGHLRCLTGTLLWDGQAEGFQGKVPPAQGNSLRGALQGAGPPTCCVTFSEICLSLSFWCLMGKMQVGPALWFSGYS